MLIFHSVNSVWSQGFLVQAKSSLVFDTLYGESYRCYVESLSSFARQYLKSMPKPSIESVTNLPAAIAVGQSKSGTNNRSTIGTMTEVIDLVRVIYTYLGEIHCHGHKLFKASGDSITQHILDYYTDDKVLILASLDEWKKVKATDLKDQLLGSRLHKSPHSIRSKENRDFTC